MPDPKGALTAQRCVFCQSTEATLGKCPRCGEQALVQCGGCGQNVCRDDDCDIKALGRAHKRRMVAVGGFATLVLVSSLLFRSSLGEVRLTSAPPAGSPAASGSPTSLQIAAVDPSALALLPPDASAGSPAPADPLAVLPPPSPASAAPGDPFAALPASPSPGDPFATGAASPPPELPGDPFAAPASSPAPGLPGDPFAPPAPSPAPATPGDPFAASPPPLAAGEPFAAAPASPVPAGAADPLPVSATPADPLPLPAASDPLRLPASGEGTKTAATDPLLSSVSAGKSPGGLLPTESAAAVVPLPTDPLPTTSAAGTPAVALTDSPALPADAVSAASPAVPRVTGVTGTRPPSGTPEFRPILAMVPSSRAVPTMDEGALREGRPTLVPASASASLAGRSVPAAAWKIPPRGAALPQDYLKVVTTGVALPGGRPPAAGSKEEAAAVEAMRARATTVPTVSQVREVLRKSLGLPWGPDGIDPLKGGLSPGGYVKYVYAQMGHDSMVPRVIEDQMDMPGLRFELPDYKPQVGDILFFQVRENLVTVGIYYGRVAATGQEAFLTSIKGRGGVVSHTWDPDALADSFLFARRIFEHLEP